MAILLVTYDLMKPGKDYKPLHDAIKKYTYCKGLESVWLLDTTATPNQVRDNLKQHIDGNDKLFVCRLSGKWASWNYGCADWLNNSARNW